ncbi:hypothetical protein TrCOL_g2009 [Triparma columacea]|uniref:Uncharacterized protein n=1 Tax=Triparma columacea TaxID=722753 RepID=A0A9W7GAS2_9STRA|nr:hypothetical protein TrCOL_g2009 [Triparma columacea]
MHDEDDQSFSSFSVQNINRQSVGSQLSQLKELAKLRKQNVVDAKEFEDLKKNILYGDKGVEEGFGFAEYGDNVEMCGRRIPGPGEFFVNRGPPPSRPGTEGGVAWGKGGFGGEEHIVGMRKGGVEVGGGYGTMYGGEMGGGMKGRFGEQEPYYLVGRYQLPQQGAIQQHSVHVYQGKQQQRQQYHHPMEKPWVRRLAEKRGRKPKISPISSPSVNGGDTDDTASLSSNSSIDGDETGMTTITKKLNPTRMKAEMQLPPSHAMQAEQQRNHQIDLQRRLEEHQARLMAGKARSRIPLLSRPPPRPILASRSEPNSARRSASAHIRRSLGKSDFTIMKLPRGLPKEGGEVMVNANTGRVIGPPYSSRGGELLGLGTTINPKL